MRKRVGELWIGLGVVHFVVILLLNGSVIGDILRDGYVDAVGSDTERNAVFWLFYLGAPFLVVGVVLRWAQRVTGTIPESAGWLALGCFLLGALAVPGSGFWLGVLLAGYTIAVARRGPAPEGAAPRAAADGDVRSSRTEPRSGTRP